MAPSADQHARVIPGGFTVLSLRFSEDDAHAALHQLCVKEHRVRAESSTNRPLDRTLFVLNVPPYCTEMISSSAFCAVLISPGLSPCAGVFLECYYRDVQPLRPRPVSGAEGETRSVRAEPQRPDQTLHRQTPTVFQGGVHRLQTRVWCERSQTSPGERPARRLYSRETRQDRHPE
ncbi:hypothetical protein cypCar_00039552 [Cyprinus carpio]|nr:hypothetical protein cypCar_00039552 [Cyprinus carpio]